MVNPKPTSRPISPKLQHPVPQRPATLRRRLSSGLDTFMSVLQLRDTTLKQDQAPQPITALAPIQPLARPGTNVAQATEKRSLTPKLHQPSRGEPEQPCPYHRTKYHSFSSIERSRCTFCGMRSSRPSSSEPCKDCRSKSPFSHIKMGFRQKSTPEDFTEIGSSKPEFFHRPSTSSDEGPRIVPPEVAAERIGNPPRRAALPVPRPGAVNNILNPPSARPAFQPPGHVSVSSSGSASNDVRTSPKLHYLHGLPDSKAYPYVHKKEVKDHLAAIDAGISSPLAEFAFTVKQQEERNRYTDFSETVFYGNSPSPALVSDVHKLFPEQSRHGNVVVEHTLVVGGHVVPKRSRAQQQTSIEEQLYESNMHARKSPALQAPRSRISRPCSRNEIYGTMPISLNDETSRKNERITHELASNDENITMLRGGAGTSQAPIGYGLLFKQLLLTCHRPDSKSTSDSEDSPVRIPDPTHIARTMCRAQGTARLPKNLSRTTATSQTTRSSSSNGNGAPPSQTATYAATHTQPRPLCNMSCMPCVSPLSSSTQSRTQDSPVNSTYSLSIPPTIVPCLRGGGSSLYALRDQDNLPPTLVWLAGEKRKSTTVARWKESKPKVRMGGMLGWAVYGARAGEARGQGAGEGKGEGVKSAGGNGGVAKVQESVPKETQKGAAEEKKESAAQDTVQEAAVGDVVPSVNQGGAEK
ncbi:hypothetical protein COCHEDRAFT_1112396 [Bipolaris maydis C5]|uniref:Uncharacterized protein n=2 Tax=Cochliobolus heterostrophus TaxID=5016 RepID=M2SRL5_COCH5|nr:hypothetical protein COCHEDRAFT_1112396 [Bipolaris maydis C5]KAJ5024228.1 hypothetical protein J3E73DRAFT_398585 [Bipolaris maydis]KAJ6206933.1 hypothetical protein PSV09DRAFT_1112396 [Bipolaris maydis]KAJ6268548.1 hypothetical protein PSV08DRAFT_378733 [Bipolaris maydis]KAJ6278793.1 hypothetical protein J3E71DRAFT_369818 [Bipolaris maydis]